MESNLRLYLDILRKHGITPTFPITARTLSKHPSIIEKFSKRDVEFAVHGFNHIDYTKLSQDAFSHHIQKAVKIFDKYNIPFSGFRFPYLKWNKETFNKLDRQLFEWESSYCILWDVLRDVDVDERNFRQYQTVLNQYAYRNSNTHVSLPRFLNGNNILEIPVSLPDDDLLFDRLGIKDEKISTQIWGQILKETYSRGELFTVQLHPERISFYKQTLKSLIRTASDSNPKIWMASFSSIYNWWKEKQGFFTEIHEIENGEYKIDAYCSKQATLLTHTRENETGNFFNQYRLIDRNPFTIRSPKKPVIGVSEDSSLMLVRLLKNEGFIFEIAADDGKFSVFLNGRDIVKEEDEIKVLEKINNAPLPLVRFWRWPNECRSALAISGDIDALTCFDFFPRLFYR